MVLTLEELHSKGILHRDIKPHNFCLENPSNNASGIYIIDFGLSKFYIENDNHIKIENGLPLCGTAKFCSLSTHKGIH